MHKISSSGDLEFVRGDTVRILLEFADANNTPMNLSGCLFKSQIRSKPNGYVVLEFNIDDAEFAQGRVYLIATHEVTQEVRLESAVWDVQVIWPDGTFDTVIGPASVTIIKDVTLGGGAP